MQQYHHLLQTILNNGKKKEDRTGTGTVSVFGHQMRFDLNEGFPLLTTKKIHFKSVAHELLWFLSGSTNVKDLQKHDVHIWDEWADENGELGPIYGKQWTAWVGDTAKIEMVAERSVETKFNLYADHINQIKWLIDLIKEDPNDRGLIVSAWNVADLPKMNLRPCHILFQCYVNEGKLSLQVYQRSCDAFLGVPFNIASYALLTHMIAHQCELEVGELIWTGGDVHLYNNHLEQAELQLSRTFKPLPTLKILPDSNDYDIFDIQYEDFVLDGYDPWPAIKAEVSV